MDPKDIALIYGAQWIGKGIDKATNYLAPEHDKAITIGLAVGLPLATRFIKMSENMEKAAILIGGFLSSNIWDYAEEMMAPAPVAVRRVVSRQVPWTAAETPGGAPEFYPPTYGQAISPRVVGRSVPVKNHVRYTTT